MAANPPVMSPPPHRGLIYLVAGASLVGLAALLVAVAWLLGWIAPRAAVYSPPAPVVSTPRAPAAAEGLEPGETVVTAPESSARTAPMMPTYSPPIVPAPAPTTSDAVTAAPQVPVPVRKAPIPPAAKREAYVQADPSAPGPTAPSFTRESVVCANCGVVSAITTYPPGLWEVRVRMPDSELQSFHFRRQPSYRIGDRVRVDGARLARD